MKWNLNFKKQRNNNLTNRDIEEKINTPLQEQFQETKTDQYASGSSSHHLKPEKVTPIDLLHEYLHKDYEQRGLEDSMLNADDSYRKDNIKLLIQKLSLHIDKATLYYEQKLNNLEFHIQTRKDAGLIDTVVALETKKKEHLKSLEYINKLNEDCKEGNGITETIILSYQRGFMKGLASISNKYLED